MKNPCRLYESVRLSLAHGTSPATIPDLEYFIPEPEISRAPSAEAMTRRFLGTVFDADVLYYFLVEHFDRILEIDAKAGLNRRGVFGWACGHAGQAAVCAFERTGQTRFLELYITFFDRLLAVTDAALSRHDEVHGRTMSSWGACRVPVRGSRSDARWLSHVTPFAKLMQPAVAFARAIRSNPDLHEFDGFAARVVDFFDIAYREFDSDICTVPETGELWYWRPFANKYEPTNHVHVLGEALLDMYAVTGAAQYEERIASFLRTFERSASIEEDGFVAWKYHPHFTVTNWKPLRGHFSEPTWKASLTVPFVYAAARDGFAVDPDLLNAMTRTIRDHVLADTGMASNLHPQGSVPFLEKPRNLQDATPAHPF